MYNESDIRTIKDIVIQNVASLQSVYLFGSYSSGDASRDSDIDIAIVLEKEIARKQKLQLLNKLWNAAGDKGYTVDFFIKNKTDFESEKKLPTMSRVIFNTGKLLWQKN